MAILISFAAQWSKGGLISRWIGQEVGQSREQEKLICRGNCKYITFLDNGKQASSKYRSESITENQVSSILNLKPKENQTIVRKSSIGYLWESTNTWV